MSEPLNKKQLYDLVWKSPMMEVAKEYGLSDRGLAKLCERNGIPVPPRGYWAKKKAGQNVVQPPLLVLSPKEPDTLVLIKQAAQRKEAQESIEEQPTLPNEIREAIARESLPQHQIKVPKTLHNPHPVVAKWIQDEERDLEMYRKYGGWRKPEKVTELERRRRRIISVLLRALEARGFEIEADRDYRQFIWVRHQRDKVGFSVTEKIKQVRRELTPEEKKEHWNANSRWKQSSEPTGLLLLRISSEFRRSYDAIDFLETLENPLEGRLNEVVVGFIQKIWGVKKVRLEREEADRRYWKKREEQEYQEKLLQEEQGRKVALENKAAQWKKAQDIKAYVQAVLRESQHLSLDPDILERWKHWALAHAMAIDLITAGDPLVELAHGGKYETSEN